MGTAFNRIYTDEQRGAVREAHTEQKVRPVRRICEMAKAGELTFQGSTIEPFKIPEATAREIIKPARISRAKRTLALDETPAEDVLDSFRRRLLVLVDTEIARVERESKKRDSSPLDVDYVRKLAAASKEIAKIKNPEPLSPLDDLPDDPSSLAEAIMASATSNGGYV